MTELSDSDVRRIAKATADELAKRNSFMMTQRDLANFFGYAYDSRAVRHLVALPDFPPSARVAGDSRPMWVRSEVESWARSKFCTSGEAVLATVR